MQITTHARLLSKDDMHKLRLPKDNLIFLHSIDTEQQLCREIEYVNIILVVIVYLQCNLVATYALIALLKLNIFIKELKDIKFLHSFKRSVFTY